MFAKDERYIIVNYHYVRNPDSRYSGIFPCAIDEFKTQIKFLTECFHIVSVSEVWEAAKRREKGRFCALTFDDGLKDQYENAVPILKQYRATGTFFLIASVFEGMLPSAHALHALLSAAPVAALAEIFGDFLKKQYPAQKEEFPIPSDRRITDRRLHEDPLTANFKETLMRIPEEMKTRFLKYALRVCGRDGEEVRKTLFMDRSEAESLKKDGMEIGAHSYLHAPLHLMEERAAQDDIHRAKNALTEIFGELSDVFSYPHGRSNATVRGILKEERFRSAVTIERRGITEEDDPFMLPRYDTASVICADASSR